MKLDFVGGKQHYWNAQKKNIMSPIKTKLLNNFKAISKDFTQKHKNIKFNYILRT